MPCPPQVPISIIPPVSAGVGPLVWQNGSQITRLTIPLNPSWLVYDGSQTRWGDGSATSPIYLPNLQQVGLQSINYGVGLNLQGQLAAYANTTVAPNNALVTATGTTAARTLANRFADIICVKDFLCDDGLPVAGDGVHDDTTGIQAALNTQQSILLPTGTYLTTSELVFKTGSKLIGEGNWSGVASTDISVGTSRILYAGPGRANSCVIRMSTAAVGVDPTVAPSGSSVYLQNCSLTNVVIDGGNLAEIGLYMVRAWSNNQLDYITVTNTLKHGFLALKCWNGSPTNWQAYKNIGAGITLGANIYGWSSSAVDESTCTSFFGYFNGYNSATSSYVNAFNETTGSNLEYGIGVFGCRGVVFLNAQGANNGGAGIYLNTIYSPILFSGGYYENNGLSSNNASGKFWNIWLNSTISSWDITFSHVHNGGTPAIRLTGTAPSRNECGVKFDRCDLLNEIYADWDNFRLVDCDRNTTFTGSSPASAELNPSGIKFSPSSEAFNQYDEGTWTPIFSTSGTAGNFVYSTQSGYYTRIGRQVFFSGRIALSATSATGSFTVSASAITGSVTAITVNSVNLLNGTVTGTTTTALLATALAASITANTATGYTAAAVGSTVTITAPISAGATPNGYTITATTSGTGVTIGSFVAFSGGVGSTVGTGVMRVGNLPFTAAQAFTSPISLTRVLNLSTAVVSITGNVSSATNYINFYSKTAAATSDIGTPSSYISTTTDISFGGTYFV